MWGYFSIEVKLSTDVSILVYKVKEMYELLAI